MMSDPLTPDFKPVTSGTDAAEAAGAFPDFPPLPPNSAVLATRPAKDGVHTIARLTYDVTHLSDDAKKLLLFLLTNALTELEKGLKGMNRIEIATKLAQRERISAMKGNGK